MVFKSFVVSLLNNYLGKYVRNLDTSNLHIGIWNGDAVLTELTLKDDALADLDLPIEVKSGSIGKLSLAIPWSNLYTKPVVVKIEDVFVVAAPVTERDFDAERAEERLRAAKKRKLLAIDKSTVLQNDETSEESQLPDDYTLFEKLTAQVIKNVQVFIKNIHVRYEDKVTSPNSPFSVGITLKHLTAETTDEFWKPCVVEATVKKVFKLVSLDSLSVYWNTNIRSSQQYGKNEEWKIKSLLRDTIKSKDETEDDFEYVLEPFSVEAHVKIDQTSAVMMDEPKVSVEVVQRDMVLGLSNTQFRCLMNLIESFELMLTNEPYRKYRPNAPLPGNAKAWWNYAFTAIVQEKIRTWSWSNIRRHRALYYDYKTLYKRELLCNDKGLENSALSSRLQELEEQLDVSSILIAREHAQSEFKINPDLVEEPVDNSSGWWSWMFGENESKKKEPETDFDLSSSFSLSALSPPEKQRLYDALDYSENSEETKYSKEYVKFKLVFSMASFEVRLLNEIRRNLAYVSMSGVSGSLLHRPSSTNTSFSLEVNDFNIYGHSSNLEEPQPHLVAFQKSGDVDLVLFDFTFELNPIHVTADYAISLILEPVKIVHDTNTVMQIVNFFKIPQSRALQELTDVASSGLQELQSQTRVGLEFAVSRQTIMYFDVNVRSPCIVVPEYGAMERPGSVFVVDFGHLTVKTDLNSKCTIIQDATESELENMLSDNFDVTLSEMQILIADKGVDWESAHAQSSSPYHLLPASEIDLEILRNTNVVCSSPEIKVSGVLQELEIKLSEEKYQQLMQFISNIPLLTEPLDEDDGQFLRIYPQTLSRHSSRLSLEEAASIQTVLRKALSTASITRDEDEFEDAVEAQDIDDNEEWFLAPHEFENKENKSDIGSISPSRAVDDNAKKNQVTLTGDFSIKKVSLVFNKFAENVDQLYINLVISDLGVKVAFLEWEMKVGANLGSLHLKDHLFKDIDGSPLTVLSSIADRDLISFSYKKVDPKCPCLNTTYQGVEHCITTEFSALNVFLHREGIVTFQDFILALIERSAKPNLQKLGERFSSYLEVIPEEEPMKHVLLNSKEKELTAQYSGITKAEVALGEVLVTLSANDRHFALLKINGLRFDVLLEKRKTCIKASLKHFDVEDLDKDTLYNKILTGEDDNLGDAEVTFYSREKGIQGNPLEVDMDVLFNFGRLKFVFLHHFVSALQNFFASFASDETRQCAQEATTQAVQIQVESLRETSPKVRLRLDINAPVIKIPVKSRSKNGVVVYLGRLQVNNELRYHSAANNSGLLDVSCIRLNSFQVTRSITAESWMGNYNLIEPTGLDITLTRCLEESCATIPAYEMEAVLEQLSVSVDEGDFKLLMKTWAENVQQSLMVEPDGGVPLDDDIFNMPEVEQHEMEKNDLTNPAHNNDQDWRMRLNAIIGNVSLMFPKSVNNERVPYLELNVDELKADMEVAGCTAEGSASLGNLCLFDHHHKGNSLKPLSVLESSRDNNLISIKYKKETSGGQPSNVTQTLDILSTVIKMHLEQNSILGIQELVTKFLESSKRYGSQLSLYNAAGEIEPDAKESETEDEEMKKSDNFKLTVNMRKVDVILSRKKVDIVRAVIEDIFTEILAADDKFVIYSRQKGLSVTDLNPLSNYRDVIAIEGNKLFDFEYHTLANKPTTSSTINGKLTFSTKPHGALSLTIGKIHLVFLYRLIADIQAFIQALVSPETTSYSYELVQKTVQDQLRSIEDQGMRIALKVTIEAPIVVFPSHSQSLDCLIADLGQLHAENEFVTRHPPNDVTQIVLIDQVNVGLESVQLSRGILDTNSRTMARRLLIQPVKMSMVLSRSMQPNARWLPYLDVKMQLDHIEMNMDDGDYQLLVCALQQNFAEAGEVVADGAGVSDDVFVSLSMVDNVDMHNTSLGEETDEGVKGDVKETTEELWDELKMDFTFSGLSLTLHHNQDVTKLSPDSLQHHNALASLCNCELQQSRGTLVTHSDSSMDLHLFLYGCVIEDARPSKMTAFPRMLSHSTEQEHGRKKRFSKNGNVEHQSMIEVVYKQTPSGEMKVNLTLQDPTLYISFPLLWSLLDFFTVSPAEETAFLQSDLPLGQSTREEVVPNDAAPYILEVTGALKNPEIILLGEPENPNSSALIVQTTIDFVYKFVDDQQNFTTSSKELVVHSCRYPQREKTLYNVVKPCAINFLYSYPGSDCEGQEIDLRIPEMKVKVSPLLLRTLLAIYNSFYGEQETVEEIVPEQVEDHEELWRPQPICKGDWYNKTSLDRVPSRIHLNTTVTEKFFMEIKSVRITLYNEVMTHRVPLLLVNSNIVSHVRDWSSELKLETDLTIEAWYHNEMLAAWEPLVESEETLSGRRHWQLQLKVFQANSHLLSFSPDDKNQKSIDEEDFRCLTTSPVFEDSRRGRRERERPTSPKSSAPQYSFENVAKAPPISPALSESSVDTCTGKSTVGLDEVDSLFSSIPSPISSDDKEIGQPEEIPQATYIVLSSYDVMQLTVTRSAVDVITDLTKVLSDVTSASSSEAALPDSPFVILNELGIHASISVSHRHETIQHSTHDLTISKRKRMDISDLSSPGSSPSKTRLHSLGYVHERRRDAVSQVRFQVKDDSDLKELHGDTDGWDEEDCLSYAMVSTDDNENENEVSEVPDTPTEKRFFRSQSMPSANMSTLITLAEERNQASRAAVDGTLQESCHEVEGDIICSLKEKVPKSSLEESGSENFEGVQGLPNGLGESRRSESGAGMVLGDIEEANGEVEEGINSMKEVENCGKREADIEEVNEIKSEAKAAPSFISGAFATMGLMAGIGAHPISSDKLVGNPTENCEALFERPEYKKADDYISVQVDGFKELAFILVTHAGRFPYQLSPKKNGRFYYIVVQIEIKHGQKRVTIRSPLQVKNNLETEIDLYVSKTRPRSNDSFEVKYRKINTVQPKEIGNVPLFSAHGNLFIQPTSAGFKKSAASVSLKDFSEINQTILTCLPEENGPKHSHCVKVICEKDSLNTTPSKMDLHHILQLHPTLSFCNFLPFAVKLKLENANVPEMYIEPGKRCHVTCVTTNKTSTFSLQVPQHMGTSWSGSFKLGGDSARDLQIEMQPGQTANNTLLIKMHYLDRGCLVVNFYSPYWIVNKTNLTIEYKSTKISSESYKQLASDNEPLLYDSASKTKKIMLRLRGCDWSNSFSMDAVGNAGQLSCKELKTSREYEMSISIELTYNRLTKIITVVPKYVIINKTEHELSIFEIGEKENLWILVKADKCVPFWPRTKSNALIVRLNDNILTSKVIRIDSLFPTIFRVGGGTLLEMNSEITEHSTTIIFSPSSSTSLPKVENLCEDISINLQQKDASSTTIVAPLTSIVYSWDEPGGNRALLWKPVSFRVPPVEVPVHKDGFGKVVLDERRRTLSSPKTKNVKKTSILTGCMGRRSEKIVIDSKSNEVCDLAFAPWTRNKHSAKKVIYWISFLQGFQRVLVFTDDKSCAREARKHCEGEAVVLEVFLSLDGVRLSVVNQQPSEIMYLGISSATSIWEVEKSPGKWKILGVEISSLLEEAWRNEVRGQRLEKDVEVDFETMSMTKPYRGTLNRRYEPGLWVHYCSSISYESFSAKVHRVQVDNQIFGTLFPCALYPSPVPVSISHRYGFKPFCEISVTYRNDPKHSLLHLRYFKVLIQEMNVKLEKDFLLAIYKMLYGDCSVEHDEEMPFQENLRNTSLTLKDTLTESDTQRLFLEHFHLSPLKINLSVSLQSNLYRSEKQNDHESDLFRFLVNSVGAPLTEVNDVLIKLACFERSGLFVTQGSLVLSAKKHYKWQALRQFHAIVLGLDVLGNPYGLLTDLQEGVKDFFYEPYQGIVLGPQEFASGIVRGVKSLLGHAIGGTTGAMSKITGTFGQAFASLSFDHDYRMKRRLRMGTGPTGIQDGVTMAGKSLFMGIVFGVSGVVTKPIQGARAEGVEGFFKGFGKGILGLVTRPTVGVFDMVTTTLDGIRRSAEQAGEHVVVRLRIDPRFSPPDAPLRPYLAYQANGNCILKSLPGSSQIINDVYVDHVPLPKEGHSSIALFTNVRMMEVQQTVFWSEWKISLDLPYQDISDSARLIHGAMVVMRKNGECVAIESTDEVTLQAARKKLEDQLYHYRATR